MQFSILMLLLKDRKEYQDGGIYIITAIILIVKFLVLTRARMKMTVLYDVAPCSLVDVY